MHLVCTERFHTGVGNVAVLHSYRVPLLAAPPLAKAECACLLDAACVLEPKQESAGKKSNFWARTCAFLQRSQRSPLL